MITKPKVIIQFPRIEGLHPINTYLHPGLWVIGSDTVPPKFNSLNNLSVFEMIVHHLNQNSFDQFVWLGRKEILQTSAMANYLSHRHTINIEVMESYQDFSVEQLVHVPDQDVLLYPGHIITNADFVSYLDQHNTHNKIGTILVSKGVQYRVGLAKLDEENGVILDFKEKPYDHHRSVFTGIVLLRKGWRDFLNDFLKEKWEPDTETRILRFQGYSSSIDLFVEYLIGRKEIKAHVMKPFGGIKSAAWWINLSQLEVWRKLDIETIFNNMMHLVTESQ